MCFGHFARQFSSSRSANNIGYLTDVEGNLDFLLRYAALSRLLTVKKDAEQFGGWRLDFRPSMSGSNNYFVFGGDAFDKWNRGSPYCKYASEPQTEVPWKCGTANWKQRCE